MTILIHVGEAIVRNLDIRDFPHEGCEPTHVNLVKSRTWWEFLHITELLNLILFAFVHGLDAHIIESLHILANDDGFPDHFDGISVSSESLEMDQPYKNRYVLGLSNGDIWLCIPLFICRFAPHVQQFLPFTHQNGCTKAQMSRSQFCLHARASREQVQRVASTYPITSCHLCSGWEDGKHLAS